MGRALLLATVFLCAACAARNVHTPDVDAPPHKALESELVRDGKPSKERTLSRCLFVYNHTKQTAAVFVDGRHAGYVGPRSSVGLYVGQSAGVTTHLRATCGAGSWSDQVEGPIWDYAWHLRE